MFNDNCMFIFRVFCGCVRSPDLLVHCIEDVDGNLNEFINGESLPIKFCFKSEFDIDYLLKLQKTE